MSATMTQQPKQSEKESRVSSRWIPEGAKEIKHPEGLGVIYVREGGNSERQYFTVLTYWGTARKASSHYSYRTHEQAEKAISDSFASMTSHRNLVAERRKDANKPTSLKVGDVIVNTWGYDQTNVDSYEVTRKTAHYVWLREIASQHTPDGDSGSMSGRVVPLPGQFLEKSVEEKHKASGEYVSFEHGSGSKWDGKRSYYNSWYA